MNSYNIPSVYKKTIIPKKKKENKIASIDMIPRYIVQYPYIEYETISIHSQIQDKLFTSK